MSGGFTDVLLSRGAARVYAVDSGTNQLAWKLRQDARVVVHEQTSARILTADHIPEPVDLVVCDARSEEHTSELQSLMRISYGVFCLNKQHKNTEVSARRRD